MKRLLISVTSVLCLALLSLPAQASTALITHIVEPDCDGQLFKLTFAGDRMKPEPYRVDYEINLKPPGGGNSILITGSVDGVVEESHPDNPGAADEVFNVMTTVSAPQLAGNTFLVSGSATLSQGIYGGTRLLRGYTQWGPIEFEVTCESQLGSLGDTVWNDLNGDGLFQEGIEAGVDDVKVYLGSPTTDPNVPGGCAYDPNDPTTTDTTENGGMYLFQNLDAGDYCVVFEKPDGFTCTTPNAVDTDPNTVDDAIDSDGASFGDICVTGTVDLVAGENDLTVDLGLVQTASLGNFVWEDLNGNGIQDADEPGVPNVDVYLYTDCGTDTPTLLQGPLMTDSDGSYLFSNLPTGDYCVSFDLATAQSQLDCTTAYFTKQGQDPNGVLDSDADDDTGFTSAVSLAAGDMPYLDLDAGVVCPAIIGDYVWIDNNDDGTQNAGDTPFQGATVYLGSCTNGLLTDDMGNIISDTTNSDGLYEFVSGTDFDLDADPKGCFYVEFEEPAGYDFSGFPNTGGDETKDSDCGADPRQVTGVVSGTEDRDSDCGLVVQPPECGLKLDKQCYVEPIVAPEFAGDCKGKIQAFTLIWNGASAVTVDNRTLVKGDEITFTGPYDNNDVVINHSLGQSVFHMSCSDDDFDGPEDCGKAAGDGKGNDSGFVNDWALEGFVDAENKVLNCTPDQPENVVFTDSCEFPAPVPPSCDTIDNPEQLTWRYDGGTCADSGFAVLQGDDFVCEGEVSPNADITVYDDKDGMTMVEPGQEFTISRDASKKLSLFQGGSEQQYLEAHMSCSQPIVVGESAGALTLVALDGQRGEVDVTYRYDVTTSGDAVGSTVTIVDRVDGVTRATFENLPVSNVDGWFEAEETVSIFGTTTNKATATVDSGACADTSAEDIVTVTAVIPLCDVSIKIDDVTDDALKLKLTNNDSRNRVATLDYVEVSYPADREYINEIKLDGALYKLDDSLEAPTGSPAIITDEDIAGARDWTKDDPSKYELDPGETRTLEIKTTKKSNKDEAVFEVTLKFAEGCEYTFTATKADIGTVLSF